MEGRRTRGQDGSRAMIYDLHVHIAGNGSAGSGNSFSPAFRRSHAFRFLVRQLDLPPGIMDAPDADRRIADLIVERIQASVVDRAVLLALDAAYRDDGSRDDTHTRMVAPIWQRRTRRSSSGQASIPTVAMPWRSSSGLSAAAPAL